MRLTEETSKTDSFRDEFDGPREHNCRRVSCDSMVRGQNRPGKNRFNWKIAPVLMLFHVGAVAALFFFTWSGVFAAIFLHWVVGGLGLGVCYHRLLTHRSYATPKWFEYFLTICGVTAMEGGPLVWVATHRKHHQFADKEGDPHSPRDGQWWSYAGWILMGNTFRQDVATLKRYVPDLAEDKFHVWLTKWHLTPTIILGLVLFAIGGFRLVLWGTFLRTVVGLHSSWMPQSFSLKPGMNKRSEFLWSATLGAMVETGKWVRLCVAYQDKYGEMHHTRGLYHAVPYRTEIPPQSRFPINLV